MELIYSPLGKVVTQDDTELTVMIYKSADSKWILEVENEERTSFVWDDHFDSDEAAWKEFERCLSEDGISAFS